MEYSSLTLDCVQPALLFVKKKFESTGDRDSFSDGAIDCLGGVVLAPMSFGAAVLDTIAGAFASVVAVATLGMHKGVYKASRNLTQSSNRILVDPYRLVLKTIDPHVKLRILTQAEIRGKKGHPRPSIYLTADGLLTHFVKPYLFGKAMNASLEEDFSHRQITSRFLFALSALSCLVTRTADAILAIPLAALSILTLGMIESVNTLALNALQAPGIVSDLSFCVINMVNPDSWTNQA